MRACLFHARAELRVRWRSYVGLCLFIALAGGSVSALVAGARRTETAYPRFLRTQQAADASVYYPVTPAGPGIPVAAIEALPQVAAYSQGVGLATTESDFVAVVRLDGRYGFAFNRFKFLAGRALLPDRADEVVLGFLVAQRRHLHVGGTLTIHLVAPLKPGEPVRAPDAVNLHVVGIEAAPGEFPPARSVNASIYLSPAIMRGNPGPAGAGALTVRLHKGEADLPAFRAAVQRLSGPLAGVFPLSFGTPNVVRTMHLQALALRLMAAAGGLAAALIFLQLLLRQGLIESGGHPVLRALGLTDRQLVASAMLRVCLVAAAGGLLAAVVAVLASPLLPSGTARIAEPHPGMAFDREIVGAGAAGVFLLVVLMGLPAMVWTAIRSATVRGGTPPEQRRSTLGRMLDRVGLPLPAALGARLALEPARGKAAVPARSTLSATAIGVGAMAMALTFGASLSHLVATPRLYGVTFDIHVQAGRSLGDVTPVQAALLSDPGVAALSIGTTGIPMRVQGRARASEVGVQAMRSTQGSITPTLLEGRLPVAADEILLGSRTLRDAGTGLGDTVAVSLAGTPGKPRPMRVVGRGVLPPQSGTQTLGQGGMVTPEGLRALSAQSLATIPTNDAFVRLAPGVGRAGAISRLQSQIGTTGRFIVSAPDDPSDIVNLGQAATLPEILAGLLALLAAATLGHLLLSAVRLRRGDFAILRSLGMQSRQIRAIVTWQSATVAACGLAVGLPLGLAAGRWAWNLVGNQVGFVPTPVVPPLAILGLVCGTLALAVVVASGPAAAAARVRPAVVLRSE